MPELSFEGLLAVAAVAVLAPLAAALAPPAGWDCRPASSPWSPSWCWSSPAPRAGAGFVAGGIRRDLRGLLEDPAALVGTPRTSRYAGTPWACPVLCGRSARASVSTTSPLAVVDGVSSTMVRSR